MSLIASGNVSTQEWRVAPDALNYIDMFEKIRAFADDVNDNVKTIGVVVTAGTSGYAVNDFLQLADGGATEAFPSALSGSRATFRVTAVNGGGQVTAVRLQQSGCYSTLPTNNGTANEFDTTILSGLGVGTVSIGTVTFGGNGWTINSITQEIDTAVIGAEVGAGYLTADTVNLVGGDTRTGFNAPQALNPGLLTLGTISIGAACTVTTRGIYHRKPGTNEVATSVVTGSGNNALTVDLTFRDFTDTTTDREMILTSPDGYVIGVRTFTDGANVANFEIMGMQAYEPANDWDAQINSSAGRYPDNESGSYVVLEDEIFGFYLEATDRTLNLIANIGVGIYSNMGLGAFNTVKTSGQYPQPLIVAGCANRRSITQATEAARWAGMNLALANENGEANGPVQILTPGGGWRTMRNGYSVSGGTLIQPEDGANFIACTPGGDFSPANSRFENQDEFVPDNSLTASSDALRWAHFCMAAEIGDGSGTIIPGDQANLSRWLAMGNEGADEIPARWGIDIVDAIGTQLDVLGQFNGIQYVDQRVDAGSGVMNSEDCLDDGTQYWHVFNNCRLDRHYTFLVLRGA